MFELIKLSPHDYYIQSPAKIGITEKGNGEVCLIDSGSDKDAARKVRQILDEKGWKLTAIFNTHSNADHIGGNKYLQSQTGCEIYAPGIECAIGNHPVLEPAFLYGGYPFKELRCKFLMAQASETLTLTGDVLPKNWEIIPLPGHFFDMVGFRTADNNIFLADCLSSEEVLEKYKIGFIYDVAAYISTLETVKKLEGNIFVPSHAQAVQDISGLAQHNIDKVKETAEMILDLCKEPICFEVLLQRLFTELKLKMDYNQYVLVGSTVRSYLAYLKDGKKINAWFENNMLLWQKSRI